MTTRWSVLAGLLASLGPLAGVQAKPTEITVRVLSKDAKFVGTSMGGALVVIKDATTDEVLARGVTTGSTGDTERIMRTDRQRGRAISSEDAAKFTTTLDIDEPRLLEVTAYGPLAQRQAANRVSATQWVVPGQHVTGGDGWLLELPGFVVDVQGPPAHIRLKGTPQEIQLQANVTMMCGCPIEPDGIWDATKFEVKALLKRGGAPVGELPLEYAGATSQFATTLTVDQPGTYEAIVYAYDPSNGNTGLDRTTFVVSDSVEPTAEPGP